MDSGSSSLVFKVGGHSSVVGGEPSVAGNEGAIEQEMEVTGTSTVDREDEESNIPGRIAEFM